MLPEDLAGRCRGSRRRKIIAPDRPTERAFSSGWLVSAESGVKYFANIPGPSVEEGIFSCGSIPN